MASFLSKLRWMFERRRRAAELRAELEFHLDEGTADGVAAGLSDADARRTAGRELGNRVLIEEDTREAWGWLWIERAGQDVRYAARMVRRRPGFTAAAVITLMLGIGANTALYSLTDALLLRRLNVEQPATLVRLTEGSDASSYRDAFTLVTRDTLQRGTRTLSGIVASSVPTTRPNEITELGERQPAFLQFVSDNYFDVLGIPMASGRAFHQPTPGSAGDAIAVISDDFWRRHYHADPGIGGAHFQFSRKDFTIAGVASPAYRGLELDMPTDIWVSVEQVVAPDSLDRTRGRWMRVMGRLQTGATPIAASAEASALLGRRVVFEPGANGYSGLRRRLSQPLLFVTLVVALVLLIACANLANLMLSANVARRRELALRRAIGASRSRLVRQLLTESFILSAAGGVLALGVAAWITSVLLGFLPPEQRIALPNLRFHLDKKVLAVSTLLSFGACLLFGLLPALRAAGGSVAPDFRAGAGAGSRHRSWLSRTLLISQVVMCTTLLIVAAVCVRSLQNLRGQDAGYDEGRLLVADVEPPREYAEARRDALIEELRRRAEALPGVDVAAFSHVGQLSGSGLEYHIGFPGRVEMADVLVQRISPGFFKAMGTAIVAGRDITPADDERAMAVAIVNESFVRRFLGAGAVLGIKFFEDGGSRSREPMEIVGVVRDSKWINLRDDAPPMYYRAYRQMGGSPGVRFVIRASSDEIAIGRSLVRAAQTLDVHLVVKNVVPFREIVDRTLVVERLVAQMSTGFGALALLIAAVGLYGVLGYSVAQRQREIGVRVAIGARPRQVEWMIVRESLVLVGCGIALGVPVAIVVTRLVTALMFGLSPHDPPTIAGVLGVLIAATGFAAWLPARRAARTDPIVALRVD